jgi:hypothetical protein
MSSTDTSSASPTEPAAATPAAAPADASAAATASTPSEPAATPSARQQAMPVLERLFQLHPKLFGARFLPLKLGAFEDLMTRHGSEFTREQLKLALGVHARSTRYLESVAAGLPRHDLDGKPVEPVSPSHVFHAILEVQRRRARTGRGRPASANAAGWLHDALVRAVEASGLSRADWDAEVGAVDAATAEALDRAFATVAEGAARRDALRRAFEASGASIEAFADMYGMKPGEVRRLLKPAGAPQRREPALRATPD